MMRLDCLDRHVPCGCGSKKAGNAGKPLAKPGGEDAAICRAAGLGPGKGAGQRDEPQRARYRHLQKKSMVGAADGMIAAV
jgi:hypothetical protein